MVVVPGGQPKQTPTGTKILTWRSERLPARWLQFRQTRELLSHVFNTESIAVVIVGYPFLQLHWKSRVVYSSHYLLNQGAEAWSQSSDFLGSSFTNSSID